MSDLSFCDFLSERTDEELMKVLRSIKNASKKISQVVTTADTGKAGTMNVYGEEQLALDVLSDKILQDKFKENELIGLIASEEMDDEVKIGDGAYAVCYDPLDGSSLVDVNLSVGTIFGVYKTDTFIGRKGSEMLAAGFVLYGPRTTIVLATEKGIWEFAMRDDGRYYISNEEIKVGEGKMFAPGNLRATSKREDYLNLMLYWMKEGYKLRYSGGMVPDINQILIKGKGIFTYPGYVDQPDGKLRLLFECAPMSYLMEKAGGKGSNGSLNVLDIEIERIDQRTPIFVGSCVEVDKAVDFLS